MYTSIGVGKRTGVGNLEEDLPEPRMLETDNTKKYIQNQSYEDVNIPES